MGMLGHNWLEEGYYEDDGYSINRLNTYDEIIDAKTKGSLLYNDGVSTSKVGDVEDIVIKYNKYIKDIEDNI